MQLFRLRFLTGLMLLILAGAAVAQESFDSNAEDPELGAFAMDSVRRTAVQGDLVCAIDTAGRLVLLDKSDPSNPQLLGETNLGVLPYSLDRDGDLVVVCAGWTGVLIVDVSDAASPMLVGSLDIGNVAYGVAMDGTFAYVAGYEGGLVIVDISDPAAPTAAGAYPVDDGKVSDVDLDEGFLFTSGHHAIDGEPAGATVMVMDISSPTAPVLVDYYHESDVEPDGIISIHSLACEDGVAYVVKSVTMLSITPDPTMYRKYLLALNVDGAGHLEQAGSFAYGWTTASNSTALAATSGRLVVGRPWITEIRDGATLELLDTLPSPCGAPVAQGQLVILPSGNEILFFDITGIGSSPVPGLVSPGMPALLPPWPNPFNPRVSIAYELEQPGDVSLEVFDPAGRRIAVLVDESRAAGPHRAEWSGKDRTGRSAPAGTYFVRLAADGRTVSRKIQLLK